MTDAAKWLMALSVDAPLAGAFVAVVLSAFRASSGAVRAAAALGVLGSFIASLGLAAVLFQQSDRLAKTAHSFGTWFELTGVERLPIEWVLQTDLMTAIWTALIAGLAGLTILSGNRQSQEKGTAFAIMGALVLASSVSFVLAANLVQLLICWTAVSLTTMAMVGWTSSRAAPVRGMQRALQAGLPGDLLLLWAVLSIGYLGSTSLVELSSVAGVARIGSGNPAFLGLIGSMLVFSVLGRCGLFPCFGWHHESSEWDSRQCILVYCVGYVPSGIWLLLKCRLLLAAGSAPLETAGGLGILGAVLAAFVACGQSEPRRRLAYLVGSQVGLLLAALGSGRELAVPFCVWHLCGLTLAAFLLFAEMRSTSRGSRLAAWCAALSLAGAIPFAPGWSQASLTELNVHPVTWHWVAPESPPSDRAIADATRPVNQSPDFAATSMRPRWGWVAALGVAQFLSALAVMGVIDGGTARDGRSMSSGEMSLATPAVNLLGVLLLIAGPCGWWLGFLAIPGTVEAWACLATGQAVAVLGLLTGWRLRKTSWSESNAQPNFRRETSRWSSVTRLSQNRLYVDQFFQEARRLPVAAMQLLATWLEPAAMERTMSRWVVSCAAWFGTQIESQQIQRVDFSVAAILLGTAVLLLTLILVT